MTDRSEVLVIAATARELPISPLYAAVACGVGPVDAAAATGAAIAAHRPTVILHVGIAGTRRDCGIAPCGVVIGSESRYCDLEVPEHFAPSVIIPDAALMAAAQRALPDAMVMPIGTSARVGGSSQCDVEAMEGFAVLRAAQLAGIPALEVRVVSNVIEEPDRAKWQFDEAFARIAEITPVLAAAIAEAVHA